MSKFKFNVNDTVSITGKIDAICEDLFEYRVVTEYGTYNFEENDLTLVKKAEPIPFKVGDEVRALNTIVTILKIYKNNAVVTWFEDNEMFSEVISLYSVQRINNER